MLLNVDTRMTTPFTYLVSIYDSFLSYLHIYCYVINEKTLTIILCFWYLHRCNFKTSKNLSLNTYITSPGQTNYLKRLMVNYSTTAQFANQIALVIAGNRLLYINNWNYREWILPPSPHVRHASVIVPPLYLRLLSMTWYNWLIILIWNYNTI